jgi:hypothetical protein
MKDIEKLRYLAKRDEIRLTDEQRLLRERLYTQYLREEQIQDRIRQLRKDHDHVYASREPYNPERKDHDHVYASREPYNPDDKWFSTGAICVICGLTADGWYCHTSPTKTCQYSSEMGYEHTDACIHCGQPDERK